MPEDLSAYEPLTRFSSRAADYARYRPTYPQAALDWILTGLPAPASLRVADLGAGTGIAARLFAQRGASVVAVEPNAQMVEAAARHTRVRYVVAPAESTGLPARSFDLALSFQAFHWFERDAALGEVRRILKPRGRFAAAWNNRERTDPFSHAYAELAASFGSEAALVERTAGLTPVDAVLRDHGFANVARAEFRHFHRMDRSSLLGYARSASYLPSGGKEYQRLCAAIGGLFDGYADAEGFVRFSYVTVVFRGDAAPAGSAA